MGQVAGRGERAIATSVSISVSHLVTLHSSLVTPHSTNPTFTRAQDEITAHVNLATSDTSFMDFRDLAWAAAQQVHRCWRLSRIAVAVV